MSKARKIAFFAPIKPPHHPIPSGDRLIARNLVKAMAAGGNTVELASEYICYSKRHGAEILAERKAGALAEAERLIAHYSSMEAGTRPSLWLTYHPYCKAPDWIGPLVSKALEIPYCTVEAARTGQGGEADPWGPWRAEAQAGIREADLHFVLKPSDREYLTGLLEDDVRLLPLAPFADLETLRGSDKAALPAHWAPGTPVLVTAGMMRKGKKQTNFELLAETLSATAEESWNLVVVGGGPEEQVIRHAFCDIDGSRIHWTGQIEHAEVLAWMRASDLFIWPGWREPIGMVYLEAQAQGLPVLAFDSLGVPLVVRHGKTGMLAPEGNLEAMRGNLKTLLGDSAIREQMAGNARNHVIENHSLGAAASQLNAGFDTLR